MCFCSDFLDRKSFSATEEIRVFKESAGTEGMLLFVSNKSVKQKKEKAYLHEHVLMLAS